MAASAHKIRVAICGGGITGATLANLLLKHQDKINFQLYESTKEFLEIGAGVGIWGRAMEAFKEAGVYDQCIKAAVRPDPNDPEMFMTMRIADQRPEGFDFGKWRFEGGPLLFHRATLLDILVARIPPDRVHFKKRLSSYSETPDSPGEVTLHFADGTTATADILVGCDGIRSSVRRHMYTSFASDTGVSVEEYVDKYVEPAWSGTVAYRTLIPTEELRKVNPEHFVFKGPHVCFGKDKHLIVYQPNDKVINMVAFRTDFSQEGTRYPEAEWVKEGSQEQLLEEYDDFEDQAQQLFQLMPKSKLWTINSLKKPLPFFVRGNTVLMGDAAHAMTPNLGVGAGMSIEDASVLTHFLTSPFVTRSTLSLALSAYNTARVDKTGEVLRRAAYQCHIFEYHAEGTGRDVEKLRKAVDENTSAIVKWKVGEDIQKGLQWIENEARRLAPKNQKGEEEVKGTVGTEAATNGVSRLGVRDVLVAT